MINPDHFAEGITATPEEYAVIGGLLINPDAAPEVSRILDAKHFGLPVFRKAYAAIMRRAADHLDIDYLTIVGDLRGDPDAPIIDVILTDSLARTPVALHVASYARRVYEAATRRAVISQAGRVAEWAYDPTASFEDLMSRTLDAFRSLDDHAARTESGAVSRAAEGLKYERRHGYPTGIPRLDGWTGGTVTGRLYVLSGQEGIGKTWIMSTLALSALQAGARVGIFSMEMTAPELFVRLGANLFGSQAFRLFRPVQQWSSDDHSLWRATLAATEDGLYIYEEQDRMDHVEALIRIHGLDVAFIDYVQCLRWPAGCRSEFEALSQLGNDSFRLARRSGCAIFAISQKNQDAVRIGKDDEALGLKNAQVFGARAAGVVHLLRGKDEGTITVEVKKNRFGPDKHAGASATYYMDKTRGSLELLGGDGLPVINLRKPAPTASPAPTGKEVPGW